MGWQNDVARGRAAATRDTAASTGGDAKNVDCKIRNNCYSSQINIFDRMNSYEKERTVLSFIISLIVINLLAYIVLTSRCFEIALYSFG